MYGGGPHMGQRHVHSEVNMLVVMAGKAVRKAITRSTVSIALMPTHKCCSLEGFLSFYL